MTVRLQKTGHRESRYERPNQKWICGWSDLGDPCSAGPYRRGTCAVLSSRPCQPTKDGDRWMCRRPEAFGGACDAGPSPGGVCPDPAPRHQPCTPRLSPRARRGKAVRAVAALSVGVLLMALGGPRPLAFVSAGSLIPAHAAIAPGLPGEGDDGANCGACHRAGGAGGADWFASVWSAPDPEPSDSDRCVSCHFVGPEFGGGPSLERVARRAPLLAHGVIPGGLVPPDDPFDAPVLATAWRGLGGGVPDPTAEIPCATCHHEHRGREAPLARSTDTQCEACHQNVFGGFDEGHPDLGDDSRDSIRFDHVKHAQRDQFEAPGESFACSRCHALDAAGRTLRLTSYEAACASCHEDRVVRPVELFSRAPEPEYQVLNGFMTLALSGDPKTLEALVALVNAESWEVEYLDEKGCTPDSDTHCAALAAGIGRLLGELSGSDRDRLRERLERALDRREGDAVVGRLVDELAAGRSAFVAATGIPAPAEATTAVTVAPAPGPAPLRLLAHFGVKNAVPRWSDAEADAGGAPSPILSDGGRFRFDSGAVFYDVDSHADPLLASWLGALAGYPLSISPDATLSPRERVLVQLERDAVALTDGCRFCHALAPGYDWDRNPWTSLRPSQDSGFNHRRHAADSFDTCESCHPLADAASTDTVTPVLADDCRTCHTEGKSRDDCLSCHVYHFDSPRQARASLSVAAAEEVDK